MGKYQAYPEYKDAESKWLDVLPISWKRVPLKHLVEVKITDGPHETPEFVDTGIPFLSAEAVKNNKLDFSRKRGYITRELHEIYSKKCLPRLDDVFMIKSGNTTGSVAIVETMEEFNIWSPLALIRSDKCKVLPRFIYYSMRADFFQTSVELSWSQGTQPNIGMAVIENLHIPVATLDEQQKIAAFLDHETAKIDALIEKQQQLIQLLKEKRQAVISHAVTKGLNPNAPMKDSGIEWLGEVPAHWVVCRLGDQALKIGSGKTPKGGSEVYLDEGVLFLRSQNVYDEGLRIGREESVYISEAIDIEMASTRVCAGDILLNITGGSIGRTCLVPDLFPMANVNQHVCIIRVPSNLRSFISLFMKSSSLKEQIDFLQNGGNREGLNFEQIRKFNIVLPPENELTEICRFISEQLDQIDEMTLRSEQAIQLMQERRTALISAAVTGKIDVRNFVEPATR